MFGYKAFDENLCCRGFRYEIGKTYEFEGAPIPCKQGFHFCKSIPETYIFYPKSNHTRICQIEALGDISTDDDIKYVTNKIRIVEEISEVWIKKGNGNSTSTGYCNTGSYNTGSRNTGSCNTGSWNTSNRNTGDCNKGDRNTGDYNTGASNTGNYNTGNSNTGSWNTGRCNTGDYNTGHCNTGDYNTGRYNTGCFNTISSKLRFFNKESDWTMKGWLASRARNIMNSKPRLVEWVDESDMTEHEKEMNPTYKTTGGFLKRCNNNHRVQEWWDDLSEGEKQCVLDLPNFDPQIFKECTGIDVGMSNIIMDGSLYCEQGTP